jgi:feruloyl-CoA synthase
MILSGNSIEHAIMTYGAILAGVAAAPVSRSYSLMSSDFAKLKYVFDLVEPKIVFVQDGTMYGPALAALDLEGVEIIYVDNPPADFDATPFESLLAAEPTDAVEKSYAGLTFDTVAKYLFTSGSTGMPKAVINTHRMMCVNAAMARSLLNEEGRNEVPVIINWLPWNHTFGGNSVLNGILSSGGTFYLDDGLPLPGFFEKTLRNLREVSPTTYSNVPSAFGVLIPELEKDDELAKTLFKNLKSLSYGGAALSQDLYDRIQAVAVRVTGHRIPFLTGYGATETAPVVTTVHWATDRMGLLGLPLPGVELKLVPVGDKFEVRVRGENITPGYHKRDDLTKKAFDDEGFYSLGDAAKFVNPDDPVQGLVFDGRVSEDFKLDTGTWVSAGRLRVQAVEASGGLMQDALVAGLDRPYIGILGFPNFAACRDLMGKPDASPEEIITNDTVLDRIEQGLRRHNDGNPGSSTRVGRALLMAEPPSMDAGEMTDKGYVNQSTSRGRRDALVQKLYADPPGNDVIVLQ